MSLIVKHQHWGECMSLTVSSLYLVTVTDNGRKLHLTIGLGCHILVCAFNNTHKNILCTDSLTTLTHCTGAVCELN